MNAKDEGVEGGAHLDADLIMGQPHPQVDLVARAIAVMDRRTLEAHQQISGVDRHWQIAIHLWPALKSVTHQTGQISGHLLAAGVDADMLATSARTLTTHATHNVTSSSTPRSHPPATSHTPTCPYTNSARRTTPDATTSYWPTCPSTTSRSSIPNGAPA